MRFSAFASLLSFGFSRTSACLIPFFHWYCKGHAGPKTLQSHTSMKFTRSKCCPIILLYYIVRTSSAICSRHLFEYAPAIFHRCFSPVSGRYARRQIAGLQLLYTTSLFPSRAALPIPVRSEYRVRGFVVQCA